ncbi:Hypothetical protein NTJ_01937 [Nesidiocoris tenuis]|uniref:Uncharacterized protein n=1 Tax=Nesidiocoris tenuis TaxID=355587 RepID=A0ABN7AE39_9HEMI|nr:Hypothetical protein NTJ_01937 [Nesidiocoris tenuis]
MPGFFCSTSIVIRHGLKTRAHHVGRTLNTRCCCRVIEIVSVAFGNSNQQQRVEWRRARRAPMGTDAAQMPCISFHGASSRGTSSLTSSGSSSLTRISGNYVQRGFCGTCNRRCRLVVMLHMATTLAN